MVIWLQYRLSVWYLAVPKSIQPADIRSHPNPRPHHYEDEYLQVTYLVTTAQAYDGKFDIYSIADAMYDPVPNLKNSCKAEDDGHEEEMMVVEKDSEV